MKGFPKVIKTKSDLVNTFKLVQKKRLKKEDWLAAVEKLENQNWIMCPVIELSEDRKTVKIMFCAEVAAGQKIKNGAVYPTVQAVETVEVEKDTTSGKRRHRGPGSRHRGHHGSRTEQHNFFYGAYPFKSRKHWHCNNRYSGSGYVL